MTAVVPETIDSPQPPAPDDEPENLVETPPADVTEEPVDDEPVAEIEPIADGEPEGEPEPVAESIDPAERHARLAHVARITQIAAGVVLGLGLLTIIGFQIAGRGQIRTGVNAFGVDLSGMNRQQATDAVSAAIATQGRQQLTLTDGSRSWPVSKQDLGVRVDVDGVVDDAFHQGRSGWGPGRLAILWRIRNEETDVGASRIAVDSAVLDSDLNQVKSVVDQPKIEAVLTVSQDGTVHYVPSQVGRSLNVDASRAAVLGALAGGKTAQALAIDETQPTRSDADFADARAKLANILDAPINLVAVDQTWTLNPSQIAYWLQVDQPQAGKPATVTVNPQWVADIVDEIGGATDRDPKSPRVWWAGDGSLTQTQPGQDGRTLDRDGSVQAISNAFNGNDPTNTVNLPVAIDNMTQMPADMSALGITTEIAEASTPYGGSLPSRMHNIELAASLLNGTIVMPGQEFSFNAELGSTSTDAGFQVAYGIAIDDGAASTVPSVGGGICQVATTVFQPVFWSGYEVDERNTHAYWIDRYTSNGYPGLDATVDEAGGLDFRWTNNSPTAVLIEAYADGENFTVVLYGTPPPWQVQVDAPVITNQVPTDHLTHYEPTSDIPDGSTREVEHAQDGFDVSITRHVTQGDNTTTDEFIAQYVVARDVVLVGSSDGTLPAEYANNNSDETADGSDPADGDSQLIDDTGSSDESVDSSDSESDSSTQDSDSTSEPSVEDAAPSN